MNMGRSQHASVATHSRIAIHHRCLKDVRTAIHSRPAVHSGISRNQCVTANPRVPTHTRTISNACIFEYFSLMRHPGILGNAEFPRRRMRRTDPSTKVARTNTTSSNIPCRPNTIKTDPLLIDFPFPSKLKSSTHAYTVSPCQLCSKRAVGATSISSDTAISRVGVQNSSNFNLLL